MAIKIFIDQGHNPMNPNAGAEGNGYREQDLMYTIGKALEALLNADPNFEALTSRNSPDEILGTSTSSSLAARVNAANAWGADAFISLHANASNLPQASGSEAFVYSTTSSAYPLAQDILVGQRRVCPAKLSQFSHVLTPIQPASAGPPLPCCSPTSLPHQ